MIQRAPRSTRTYTPVPYTTLVRSDQVEADLRVLPQDPGGPPQHHPDPQDVADLAGPPDRQVQQVAERDLQQKGGKHRRQHRRQDVLGAAVEPAADARDLLLHGLRPPIAAAGAESPGEDRRGSPQPGSKGVDL